MNKNNLLLFLSLLVPVVFYQNCGEVSLSTPVAPAKVQKLKGEFCGSHEAGDTFRVRDFYIVNLNARIGGNGIFGPDSDGDGILDSKEDDLAVLNVAYNKTNRRSFGILDGICYIKSSTRCELQATPSFLTLGLQTTDFPGMSGVDTDGDGLTDLVEVLFKTNISTQEDFSDGDDLNNYEEVKVGRDPNSDSDITTSPSFLLNYDYYPVGQSEKCAENQILYEFEVFHLPLADTLEFTSTEEPEFSHEAGENIILIYFVSTNDNGTKRLYQTHLKTSRDVEISPLLMDSFSLISEY